MNLAGILNRNDIKLIGKENIVGDKYVFHFEVPETLTWKPIESGVFKFRHSKLKGGNSRIFNIASTVNENLITIGTNISSQPSEFKAKLKQMEVGDLISLRGPFSLLAVDAKNQTIALIAGGTGITPIRALVKDLDDNKQIQQSTIFYVDSNKDFMFKDEIDEIVSKNPKIKIKYLDNRQSLNEELLAYVTKYQNDSTYFIAGSREMIKVLKATIKNNGVNPKNIVNQTYLKISKFL